MVRTMRGPAMSGGAERRVLPCDATARDRYAQRWATMGARSPDARMYLRAFRNNMQRKGEQQHRCQANKL
jgi:hypothetical protein